MPWTRGISDVPSEVGNNAASKRYRQRNIEAMRERWRAYYAQRDEVQRAQRKQYDSIRQRAKREARWAALASRPRPEQCEICGDSGEEKPGREPLVFDHCHATGRFRGWLCSRCNRVLGSVGDNIELLKKMVKYLNAMDEKTS